jgi:serine/threonine protein kinase
LDAVSVTARDPYDDDAFNEIADLSDEEFARRMEAIVVDGPAQPDDLPDDLCELFEAIMDAEILRNVADPDEPPYPFEGFEAYRCLLGGIGMIVEAHDPGLDRKVALKFWKQSGLEAQTALLVEARTLAKLAHPNIVTVYEARRWRERVFFVMEWIDGVDGKTWMDEPHTWREVRAVFVEAARGLAAAHDRGIQHRDFKPENMLVGNDGRVVVADFGIAESLRSADGADTQWGTPAGTPAYMAPERLRCEPGDARSDQFSFCVAMWRGLFGFRPFAGRDAAELLESIELDEIQADDDVEVPSWLIAVLLRGLAANPDERYRDMHELIAALFDEPPPDDPRGDEDPNADPPTNYRTRLLNKPDVDPPPRTETPATPSNLVEGNPWAHWGPLIDGHRLNEEAIELVARLAGRPQDDVANTVRRVTHVPRYWLLEELANNKLSATVYWGVDVLLAREVAIKIHRDRRQYSAQWAVRESQAMARFDHPNVVQIYDMGEHGSWLYSVIEYCDIDLRNWHFDLGWAQILTRINEAANGLTFLHENGFAHGDIKPANILIRGGAKLADFGHATRPGVRAAFIGENGEAMTALRVGGTAGYVAPEVAKQGPGFAGDVFALAVTTWVCIFGEMPFPPPPGVVATVAATAAQVEKCPPKEPSKVPAGLPSSVLPLLKHALDPDPARRPSLGELAQGLRAAVEHDERRRRLRRGVPVFAASVFALLAVGFSIGAVSYRSSGGQGSLLKVALPTMDPVTRAEDAIGRGDMDAAVDVIYETYDDIEDLSDDEAIALADGTKRIAQTLEDLEKPTHAIDVWYVVIRLYRHAGQWHQAEEARQAKRALINLELYQNK